MAEKIPPSRRHLPLLVYISFVSVPHTHSSTSEAMSAPASASGSGKPEMTLTVLGCGRSVESLNATGRC